MASGTISRTALSATTYTTIASGPASGYAQVLSVSLCNRGATATCRLAIVATASAPTPASNADFLEYDSSVNGSSVLERTGIVLNNGQALVAYGATANFTAVVYGLEDTAVTATGVQGKYDLSATTWTQVTAGPSSGRIRTVSVNFVNRNATAVTVRLAISTTPTTPANTDYLEYNVSIPANGVLERTGIVLSSGIGVGAYASATGVSVICYGVDDTV